jgi:DNA-binding winged helix-turn-helix (wHTH) protein
VAPRIELNFPNPVERPADLFDRTSQLELIRETVTSSARRIAVIMGERVTGKTSLLNAVRVWAVTEPSLAVLRIAPVASCAKLMEEILEGMASELDTTLYQLGHRDATGGFTQPTVMGFTAVAAELSDLANRTFLVCLDELDSMLVNCRDGQSATEILDFIMYVSNSRLPIRFVFTLTRATPQIMRADATPFITAARIAELAPWTVRESREFVDWLLSPSLAVDDDAHELLFAEAGGHPYLIKAILQRIVDAEGASSAGEVISADQVHAGIVAALAAPEVHLTLSNIIAAHFSLDEVSVLQRLAKASGPMAAADFALAASAFSELRRRHYVRPAADGFVLAFGLLGRWLLGQSSADSGRAADGAGRSGPGIAKLVLDETRRRVFLGNREIQLSRQEYLFLQRLARELGTIVDRTALATAVWPDESGFEGGRDSRLSQLVYRLRTLLGDNDKDVKYVETHRGFGFSAVPENVERIPGGEY